MSPRCDHLLPGSRTACVRNGPSDVQLERLAAAFELTLAEVRQDWSRVHDPAHMNGDVVEQLRLRHAWDATIAPYYLSWLERAKRCR